MIKPLDAETIHKKIAPMVENGVPVHEALLEIALRNDYEVETVAAIVNGSPILRALVRASAEKVNLVKKDDTSKLCD